MRIDVPSKSERDDGGNNPIGWFGFFVGVAIFVAFIYVIIGSVI